MTWVERVVAELCELKANGWTFDRAWAAALEAHPPRNRDYGEPAPSLFDEPEEPSLLEFARAACSDAWHGRKPHLRHLPAMMVDGEVIARAETPRPGQRRPRIAA
jgi:hypothetical protein